MSALSYICEYGSSEDQDSSSSECENKINRPKLPRPNLSKVSTVTVEEHVDDPCLHQGRLRSFPHVRGNWPTFVYIQYPDGVVSHLISKLKDLAISVDESCLICDNIHLSLSRTVVLQYHLITTFTASLQAALSDIKSFDLQFESISVYCNDEESRTFIALKVDHYSNKQFLLISKKVDEVLKEFKLPTFYEEPSFHSSILWTNGNKKSKFEEILDQFNNVLSKHVKKNQTAISIDRVCCKIGNKHFNYCLK